MRQRRSGSADPSADVTALDYALHGELLASLGGNDPAAELAELLSRQEPLDLGDPATVQAELETSLAQTDRWILLDLLRRRPDPLSRQLAEVVRQELPPLPIELQGASWVARPRRRRKIGRK